MLPGRPLVLNDYSGFSRRRNSRRGRRPKPEYERNIVSAFFALTSAVLVAIAEAEPKWVKIDGGRCDGDYLGLYKVIAYKSWRNLEEFCYTQAMVTILRITVAICCISIVASMFACLLDLCGTLNKTLKCIKDNSVANILTGDDFIHMKMWNTMWNTMSVWDKNKADNSWSKCQLFSAKSSLMISKTSAFLDIMFANSSVVIFCSARCIIFYIYYYIPVMFCVATNGLVFWVTRELEKSDIAQNPGQHEKITVTYEVSFYLVAAAGASSVLATAFGVLYCQRRHRQNHMTDDELELMYAMHNADSLSDIPPPAYSP